MKASFQFLFVLGILSSTHLAKGQPAQSDSTSAPLVSKGKILISSIFNFSVTNTANVRITGINNESKQSQLGGYVGAGKMLTDHWGFLIDLGAVSIMSSSPTWVGAGLINLSVHKVDYSLVPMIRYYKSIDEGVYFFVQAATAISFGTLESDELGINNSVVKYSFKTQGYSIGISPGFSYFITSRLSSELAIGLVGYSQYSGSDDFGNSINISSMQSLVYLNSVSLGFVFFLSGKK